MEEEEDESREPVASHAQYITNKRYTTSLALSVTFQERNGLEP